MPCGCLFVCHRDLEALYGPAYGQLLLRVLNGEPLATAVETTAQQLGISLSKRRRDMMTACYLGDSFPALLHYAYKYATSFEVLSRLPLGESRLTPFQKTAMQHCVP